MKAQTVQSADIDPGRKDSEVSPSSVTLDVRQKGCRRGKDGWKGPGDSSEALVCDRTIASKRETGEKMDLQGSELEGEDC